MPGNMNIEAADFEALNQNKSRGVRVFGDSYRSDVLKQSKGVISPTGDQSQSNAMQDPSFNGEAAITELPYSV